MRINAPGLPGLSIQVGQYNSSDGGMSWTGNDFLGNSNTVAEGDPSTAFNSNNQCFIGCLNVSGTNSQNGMLLQSSMNNGNSWSALSTAVNSVGLDKEMIAADNLASSPFRDNLYSAWHRPFASTFLVEFSRSIDNGVTFSTPIILKSGGLGQGTNVQTGINGEVYVCWADYDNTEMPSHGLGFCRSTNGGVSFEPYQRVLNYQGIREIGPNPLFGNTRVNDFPSMAVDKSSGIHRGRIYVTLPVKENGNGKSIVQVTYSDNRGDTWSNPITVSISNGRQNWFPWIAVDDCTGNVWVAYYSLDEPSGFGTNTYVANSTDGGLVWENQKVSDVSHTTAPIVTQNGYAGDYIGITAGGGKAYPIWADSRNGIWQIYCSPVNTANYIIAGSSVLCPNSSGQYSVNSPSNSTVIWSVSGIAGAAITPNNNPCTVTIPNNITQGVLTISANISGGCSGIVPPITKQIYIGSPYFGASYKNGVTAGNPVAIYFPNQGSNNLFNNVCIGYGGVPNVYIDAQPYGASNINWSVPNGYATSAFSLYTGYGNRAYFAWNYGGTTPPGYIQASVSNGCGTYSQIFAFKQVNCGTQGGNPCPQAKGVNYYTISPNPASDNIKIGISNKPAPIDCPTLKVLSTQNGIIFSAINVYDNLGTLVKSYKTKDAKNATIQISNLISGTYTVEIIQGDYVEKQKIIIQK